jgi:hypothetical protein
MNLTWIEQVEKGASGTNTYLVTSIQARPRCSGTSLARKICYLNILPGVV